MARRITLRDLVVLKKINESGVIRPQSSGGRPI